MIHLSGAFEFQRPGPVEGRLGFPEFLPAAIYIGMTLLNDDGTPVFQEGFDELPNVRAIVTMSRPQRLGGADLRLDLKGDVVVNGYVGLTAAIDLQRAGLPVSWLPLAVLIFVHGLPVGVITAAPEPGADTGIVPPIRPAIEPAIEP